MKRVFAFIAAAAVVSCSPPEAQSPVLGSWEGTMNSPNGAMEMSMTFTETDGAYDVAYSDNIADLVGFDIPSEIADVEVEGNSFSFLRVLDFQGTAFEITYAGTVEGDTLTGEAVSDQGGGELAATRVAAAE